MADDGGSVMENVAARLMAAPYVAGGASMRGVDCWGLVEVFYRMRGVDLAAYRGGERSAPGGFAAAFAAQDGWREVVEPRDGDVVVLRAAEGRKVFEHGHCGIALGGDLLHACSAARGVIRERLADRHISGRITGYWRHDGE
jgi:cell wall-associated NlpC family hydrolase